MERSDPPSRQFRYMMAERRRVDLLFVKQADQPEGLVGQQLDRTTNGVSWRRYFVSGPQFLLALFALTLSPMSLRWVEQEP